MLDELGELGERARQTTRRLRTLDTNTKNKALRAIADVILERQSDILLANSKDITAGQEAGLDEHLLERLLLTEARLDAGLVAPHPASPEPVVVELHRRRPGS